MRKLNYVTQSDVWLNYVTVWVFILPSFLLLLLLLLLFPFLCLRSPPSRPHRSSIFCSLLWSHLACDLHRKAGSHAAKPGYWKQKLQAQIQQSLRSSGHDSASVLHERVHKHRCLEGTSWSVCASNFYLVNIIKLVALGVTGFLGSAVPPRLILSTNTVTNPTTAALPNRARRLYLIPWWWYIMGMCVCLCVCVFVCVCMCIDLIYYIFIIMSFNPCFQCPSRSRQTTHQSLHHPAVSLSLIQLQHCRVCCGMYSHTHK